MSYTKVAVYYGVIIATNIFWCRRGLRLRLWEVLSQYHSSEYKPYPPVDSPKPICKLDDNSETLSAEWHEQKGLSK